MLVLLFRHAAARYAMRYAMLSLFRYAFTLLHIRQRHTLAVDYAAFDFRHADFDAELRR